MSTYLHIIIIKADISHGTTETEIYISHRGTQAFWLLYLPTYVAVLKDNQRQSNTNQCVL